MVYWAEIDAGPITRRLLSPPEYSRVSEKGNALTESTTISMGRLVKDLSYKAEFPSIRSDWAYI